MAARKRPQKPSLSDQGESTTPPALNNALGDIAGRIRDAEAGMAASSRAMAERALEAGRLLLEAKAACPHGQWLPFLALAGTAERQAQRLMTLARSGLKTDTVSELGMRAAFDLAALRKLPKAGEVLVLTPAKASGESADDGDAAADAAPGAAEAERLALVWEVPQLAGYFHVVGWRDACGAAEAEITALGRPISGERPEYVFAVADMLLSTQSVTAQRYGGSAVTEALLMRGDALAAAPAGELVPT